MILVYKFFFDKNSNLNDVGLLNSIFFLNKLIFRKLKNLLKIIMQFLKRVKTYIYDLYGVCNHSGSVHGGHYTSFVKNANGHWYHYNDTSVSKVGLEGQIISPKAYCFFYRKRANI